MATKIEILKLQQFKLAIKNGTNSIEYKNITKEIEKIMLKEIEKEINNERSIRL